MNKLSKIILTLLLFGVLLPCLPAQAAGSAIFRLTSVKTDYNVGDNIYIDVMVEPNGANINTVRLISDFTGVGVLQVNDFNLGTAWPIQSPGEELNNTTQHINVGGFILVDSVNTNSKFGTLIFKANQVGTSTINISTGSHLISTDQVEQLDLTASQNITINVAGALPPANRAPVFDQVGTQTIELGQSVEFQVRASDPDGDNVTLTTNIPVDSIFENVTSGVIAQGDFSWTPTANGVYSLQFFATDDNSQGIKTASLNVSVNVSVPVIPGNLAPIFQPVGNKSILLGQAISFRVSATDPDGDNINLTWTLPSGSNFGNVINNAVSVSGDFSWTPTTAGVYTATFLAEDDDAIEPKSKTMSVSIGVSVPPNHVPVFEPITEKTVTAGQTLTFNISATDPDGDNVILSLEPLENAILTPIATGITATSGFSWKPVNFGIYYAVFKATDDNLNPLTATQTVRITVFGGQCPPCTGGGGGGGSCPIPKCEKQVFDRPLLKNAPTIISPTHASQSTWYSNNTPQFVWEIADQNLGYVFNIDQNPLSDPSIGYFFTQAKVFSFSQVEDGFWYFHLKVKYADGFGPTAHYQIKVDTTPPEFFKPSIEGDKLYFSALDPSSGVAYFEMKLDDGNWQKAQSPYNFSDADKKGNLLILRAIDNAGNVIEAGIDLSKMEVLKEDQKKYIISQPEYQLPAPTIDLVGYPLVYGKSLPGSKIYLFLSTETQTIIYTLTDYQGNWLAYIDKKLNPGKYEIYAISNFNNADSQPSEKVYFSVSQLVASQFPWKFDLNTLGLLAAILLGLGILMLIGVKVIKFALKEFQKRLKDYLEVRKVNGLIGKINKKLINYGKQKKK